MERNLALRSSRTTYRIESVLSSFVPWLFHNRLWYNSACSCIPYVYAPATPTSGRVNTISRVCPCRVSRIKNILRYLLTGHTRNTWARAGLHFILKGKFLSLRVLEIYQEVKRYVLLTELLRAALYDRR